jgi:hypothetical protein
MVEKSIARIVGRVQVEDADFTCQMREQKLETLQIVTFEDGMALRIKRPVLRFEVTGGGRMDLFFG